nr:EOG090X0HIV [Eurycercus lamellatus]
MAAPGKTTSAIEAPRSPWCPIEKNKNKIIFSGDITSVSSLFIHALQPNVYLMSAGAPTGHKYHLFLENSDCKANKGIRLRWRQGLFLHCFDFAFADYIRATAAVCILALATDVFATLLTGLGLQSGDPLKKRKYYRLAIYIMLASLVSVLVALVLYPVCFARELPQSNRNVWEFGWAYGVAWGAAIFLFGASVLLMCDKEAEEVYYKERDVHATEKAAAN